MYAHMHACSCHGVDVGVSRCGRARDSDKQYDQVCRYVYMQSYTDAHTCARAHTHTHTKFTLARSLTLLQELLRSQNAVRVKEEELHVKEVRRCIVMSSRRAFCMCLRTCVCMYVFICVYALFPCMMVNSVFRFGVFVVCLYVCACVRGCLCACLPVLCAFVCGRGSCAKDVMKLQN